MLDCEYFRKKDINFKELIKDVSTHDTATIAKKLGISKFQVQKYLSPVKLHADVRVPQLLIDSVNEIKSARKASVQLINQKIKSV